jgi:hypothetical protein
MEQEYLSHPGTVLLGPVSKKRNVPTVDNLGKRHQRGPSSVGSIQVPAAAQAVPTPPVPVEEDFEPLTDSDMRISAGIPPILQNPGASNKDRFEPTNWRTTGATGVVTASGKILQIPTDSYNPENQSGKFGFGFHPENVLGRDWVNSYSMKIGVWLRSNVIDFAKTLAGKLQYKSVSDVLETGFEDINSLIREAQMDSSDLPNSTNPVKVGPIPAQVPPTFSQAAPSKAMYELWRVASMVSSFGSSSDSVQFYRYLTSRTEKRDALYNRWLTLPMNLSEIHFTPVAKAGIEAAIDRIALSFRNIPRDNIFAEVLRSEARETFAELAALYIQRDRFANPNGDRRKHTGEMLETRIDLALERFSHLSMRPIRGPDDESTIALKPVEGTRLGGAGGGSPYVKREQMSGKFSVVKKQNLEYPFF